MNTQAAEATTESPGLGPAEQILREMGRVAAGDLIPLLQRLQEAYGYLPPAVLREVGERTGIPASRLYGVITFYAQFYLTPRGQHTIRCCRGTACHVRGGKAVAEEVMRELRVGEGGTTDDKVFTFETVACLGTCFLAPVMMVGGDYYGLLTPDRIKSILRKYSQG